MRIFVSANAPSGLIGVTMSDKPKEYYRVSAVGIPNVPVVTNEVDAKRLKREILMVYPAATVRIEKTEDSGRAK